MKKYLKYDNKTNAHVEEFFNNYIATIVLPFFYRLNFTANMITIFSLIIRLIGIYFLYRDRYIVGSIVFFIGYIFDDIDGAFAREYNMVSEFGDFLDHFSDVITTILLLYILYKKFGILVFIVFLILYICACYHISCQEETIDIENRSNYIGSWCRDKRDVFKCRLLGGGNVIFFTLVFFIFYYSFFQRI